ncbi:MAG: flagellar basal body P-ring formation chaperone FlgA [Desulfobacterales bacterium]|jgi:flagella basal body P-ring formation protein FlgA|nr:flagellar basal body P-ring formation chaperone FlgA [Desulfobacterales bacterium]
MIYFKWMVGVFSLLFFHSGSAVALDSISVRIDAAGRVAGESIFLKDIAMISAPAALKDKVGDIRLGRAPQPGKEKKISGRRIMAIIKAAGVLPADAAVSVPDTVCIEGAYQRLQEALLRKTYDGFLSNALKGTQFEVRRFKVRGANRFPLGKLALTIAPCGKQALMGNVSLSATVRVNGKKCGKLTLLGWVDRFARAVCAARAVAHHAILTEADLTVKSVNLSEYPPGVLVDIAEAAGQLAKVSIRPGTPIRSAMLEVPPLVQKGNRVKILAGSGKLKVTTMGIAKSSGGMGEQVRVENPTSNKIIIGRVSGESTVDVLF